MYADVRKPTQARSQETLEAIVRATETLLEQRPFAEISVQDIVMAAGCSNGSFYARFAAKEDLLPHLYARYDDELAARIEALDASQRWADATLAQALETCIDEHIRAYAERPHLMREFMLFVRRSASNTPSAGVARRNRLFGRAVERLTSVRTERGAPVATEAAIFALTVIGNVVRELVLFGDKPLSRPGALPHATLKRNLMDLLLPYLEGSRAH
jgi:AcrR family transcriptional regulator